MDFAATTVKLPDGEYVPFLFTVKAPHSGKATVLPQYHLMPPSHPATLLLPPSAIVRSWLPRERAALSSLASPGAASSASRPTELVVSLTLRPARTHV